MNTVHSSETLAPGKNYCTLQQHDHYSHISVKNSNRTTAKLQQWHEYYTLSAFPLIDMFYEVKHMKHWKKSHVCIHLKLRICSLIARKGINRFAPNLAHFFLKTRMRTKTSKLRKSIMSSIPGDGSSRSSRTSHDRRTMNGTQLFASKITETKATTPKTVLGSSPDKYCSSSSDVCTIEERRTD
jgi:hypothetical protein